MSVKEKRTAHYPLADVKQLVNKGAVCATATALKGAADLGFSFDDMKYVLVNLEEADLYKSMTSKYDLTGSLWQDVYRYPAEEGEIYLKIQIVEFVVIVSFKEL